MAKKKVESETKSKSVKNGISQSKSSKTKKDEAKNSKKKTPNPKATNGTVPTTPKPRGRPKKVVTETKSPSIKDYFKPQAKVKSEKDKSPIKNGKSSEKASSPVKRQKKRVESPVKVQKRKGEKVESPSKRARVDRSASPTKGQKSPTKKQKDEKKKKTTSEGDSDMLNNNNNIKEEKEMKKSKEKETNLNNNNDNTDPLAIPEKTALNNNLNQDPVDPNFVLMEVVEMYDNNQDNDGKETNELDYADLCSDNGNLSLNSDEDNLSRMVSKIMEVIPNDDVNRIDLESDMSSDEDSRPGSVLAIADASNMSISNPDAVRPKKKELPCKECGEKFPNRYFLRKHTLRVHDNEIYKCKVCSFTSVYPEKLKHHIIKLHVAKKEKYDKTSEEMEIELKAIINKNIPRKVVMEDGVLLGQRNRTKIRFACATCEGVFNSRYTLERHVRSHTREKPYKCDVCPFSSSYQEHLTRHLVSVHLVVYSGEPVKKYIPKSKQAPKPVEINNKTGKPKRPIARKRFECAACGAKSTHKTDLVDHIREKHPNAHIESMAKPDGSKIHLIVTNVKKPKERKTLTITCLFCSKVFHDNWKYKVHLRSHTGVKPFRCSVCSFRTTTKMTVRDHILRKHKGDDTAKIVLRTLGIDGETNEIEIPVPPREYKCEVCNEEFQDNYQLKNHKRLKHIETLPFSCKLCDFREYIKGNLIKHCMEEHPDDDLEEIMYRNNQPIKLNATQSLKLPTCDICNKRFTFQSQLYIHQKIHTGERTYSCDNCDYRTNNKSILEKHMFKVHLGFKTPKKESKKEIQLTVGDQDGEFLCDLCVYTTNTEKNLPLHKKKVHGVSDPQRKRGRPKKVETADVAVGTA